MAFRGEENSGYRAEKSSARLERDCQINNDITFSSVKLEGFVFICLLSSAHMTVNEAIVSSYLAGTRDTLKDADITLRTMIKKAFDESTSLKWQPKADELGALIQDKIPEKLLTFLNVVFSRQDPKSEKCKKKRCLIYSIGQDICCAVKNGEWKLPKHVFICLTICQLYRSKQLTQILNRMGHCECYQYGLEVETALAEALDNTSTHLTAHFVIGDSNLVFHSEWENLRKATTNLTGSNVVNSAAGVMLQEVTNGLQPPGARTLPEYERDIKNKKTSYKVSVLEKLHQSQYTTVLDQSFPRMPLSFLHWETFLNLIYVY